MPATRTESDSLGTIEVPADRCWGAQTERSRQHFRIGVDLEGHGRMPLAIVHALALIKKAAAITNTELGLLTRTKRDLVVAAADEVISGALDDHFPLVIWQTGSGTQTNMNVNEVIAGRANQLAGQPLGGKSPIHPNDDVNLGQSSNDTFPTAMHLAALDAIVGHLLPAVGALRATLAGKALAYRDVVKIGRTHLQDATPLTLGQEIGGWVAQLDHAAAAIEGTLSQLRELALGGTAVGTGLNTHPRFAARVADVLCTLSGHPVVTAPDKFAALAAHDAFVGTHGAIAQLGAACTKIANDVRWLASGPRAGIGELTIPANEPGSSIMPGKVNPTQSEALTMVCARVFGNQATITFAASQGNFELNVFKPVIAATFLESCRLLGDAIASFDAHCASGLAPDLQRIRENVGRSLMLVTALAPHLGYDAAARIAERAHHAGSSLKEAALALGLLTAEQFDAWVRPEHMVGPEAED